MALAALISAIRDADDGSGLTGTLPVAGRLLIERQARLAARAGASRLVILIERLPGALTAAIDRLRRDGISIDIARSAGDAADRFHPDERVLVFAEGALVDKDVLDRLATCPAPALLTMGEGAPAGPFERIDAGARWAGLLLVSGEMLRKTVAMLGDWDLHSTLLRRIVGASGRRIDIADGADLGEAPPVLMVRSRAGARSATHASFSVDRSGDAWPERLLYGPLATFAASILIDRPLESRWLRWGAIAISLLAAPALWKGWIAAGLILLVAGALLDTVGSLLASVRLTDASIGRIELTRAAAGGIALLAFADHRSSVDWTPLLLGIATVAIMAAKAREAIVLARIGRGVAAPRWIANTDALVLVSIIFALIAQTLPGLAALSLYAASSFAAVQQKLMKATTNVERA